MSTVIYGGDLRTGLILVRSIPAQKHKVTTELRGAGTISVDVGLPMVDALTGVSVALTDLIIPGKSFLAVEEDGRIVNAGPVWTDHYEFDTYLHSMGAAGLRSYWDYRFVLPVLASGQTPAAVTSTWTTSLRTQAKGLVQQAQAWTGGAVPVVFEADIAGTDVRTYKGSDLVKVGEALSNLEGVENGPDVAFRPRKTADGRHIEWLMVTGDPLLHQSGADHVWDTSVPGSSVRGASIDRDARGLSSNDYEQSTSGDTDLWAVAVDSTLPDAGYPIMETSGTRNSVELQATLQGYANAAVKAGRAPLETFSFYARKSATPKLADVNEGDYCRIVIGKNNPRKPAGRPRHRILSIEADETDWVKYTCSPERDSYPMPEHDGTYLTDRFNALARRVDEANRGR